MRYRLGIDVMPELNRGFALQLGAKALGIEFGRWSSPVGGSVSSLARGNAPAAGLPSRNDRTEVMIVPRTKPMNAHEIVMAPLAQEAARAASKDDLGVLPEWNLADLYPGMEAPEFKRDLAHVGRGKQGLRRRLSGQALHAAFGVEGERGGSTRPSRATSDSTR